MEAIWNGRGGVIPAALSRRLSPESPNKSADAAGLLARSLGRAFPALWPVAKDAPSLNGTYSCGDSSWFPQDSLLVPAGRDTVSEDKSTHSFGPGTTPPREVINILSLTAQNARQPEAGGYICAAERPLPLTFYRRMPFQGSVLRYLHIFIRICDVFCAEYPYIFLSGSVAISKISTIIVNGHLPKNSRAATLTSDYQQLTPPQENTLEYWIIFRQR